MLGWKQGHLHYDLPPTPIPLGLALFNKWFSKKASVTQKSYGSDKLNNKY